MVLEGLSADDLNELLELAQGYREAATGHAPQLGLLAGRTISNLFFANSTRTPQLYCGGAAARAKTLDLTSAAPA